MFALSFSLTMGLILLLWTQEVFFPKKKKPKSPEQELGDALAKYLEKGVKVRMESKD